MTNCFAKMIPREGDEKPLREAALTPIASENCVEMSPFRFPVTDTVTARRVSEAMILSPYDTVTTHEVAADGTEFLIVRFLPLDFGTTD